MEWLNNPWVIGIGGGILSGLGVTVVSRILFSRRDREEYLHKLQSANQEIVYALRPGIPEGHLPDRQLVESLVNATARKYLVDKNDMHGPIQIGEELAKEIMDSSFISAKTKQVYSKQLACLFRDSTTPSNDDGQVAGERLRPRSVFAGDRSALIKTVSVLLGAATAVMTMVLVYLDESDAFTLEFAPFVPPLVAIAMMILMAVSLLFRNKFRLYTVKGEGTRNEFPEAKGGSAEPGGER